jgi:hypothetical protein
VIILTFEEGMNRILIALLSCIAVALSTGCSELNENRIYVLVGTESPDFDLAKEGSTSQFMVTGPSKEDSYGEIKISADGTEKGKFSWGGSICEIGAALTPPRIIELEGKTSVELFYGIVEIHPDTGEGTLKRKGKIQPGLFKIALSKLQPTDETSSNHLQ